MEVQRDLSHLACQISLVHFVGRLAEAIALSPIVTSGTSRRTETLPKKVNKAVRVLLKQGEKCLE